MRSLALLAVAGLGLGLLPQAQSGQLTGRPVGPEPVKPSAPATCGDFGTAVEFADSPSAAAKQATKEEKLVLVLHVSGEFENSGLT